MTSRVTCLISSTTTKTTDTQTAIAKRVGYRGKTDYSQPKHAHTLMKNQEHMAKHKK